MKLIYKLRVFVLTVLCGLATYSAMAQVTHTDYFMKSSYFRTNLNPALRPDQGYIIIPMLPNVGLSLKTNTLNLDHLTYPVNGGRATFMHKDVSSEKFLSRLSDNNYLMADANYKIGGVGFYKGDGFWTVDLGVRTHVDANIPKSVFELAKVGFVQNQQTKYDLKNLNATVQGFVEAGVGYSRPFMDNALIAGVKVKALTGIGDFDLNVKDMSIEAGPDQWRARSQVTLKGSAIGLKTKYTTNDKGEEIFDKFELDDKLSVAGWGLGFDLGVEFDLGKSIGILEGMKVSGALTDIGYVAWNNKSSVQLESSLTDVVINPNDYSIHNDGSTSLNKILEDVVDDLTKSTDLHPINGDQGRTSSLRSTLNVGAEYQIVPEKLSGGVLFSNRFGKYFNSTEVAISANYVPAKWFAVSGGYSFVHSAFDTFGLALHLAPSKGLRLFLASDYVLLHHNSDFLPTTSKGINMQLGISIPLGEKK